MYTFMVDGYVHIRSTRSRTQTIYIMKSKTDKLLDEVYSEIDLESAHEVLTEEDLSAMEAEDKTFSAKREGSSRAFEDEAPMEEHHQTAYRNHFGCFDPRLPGYGDDGRSW